MNKAELRAITLIVKKLGWITVDEPERKIKALSTMNFHFRRFYTLREFREVDELTGKMKSQWFIGPCVTRI